MYQFFAEQNIVSKLTYCTQIVHGIFSTYDDLIVSYVDDLIVSYLML